MSSIFWKPADGVQRNEDDEVTLPPSVLYSSSQQSYRTSTSLAQQRMLLPIYKHRKQIMYAVEEYQCVVVVGATGSGKSTQIPQYLVEAGWTRNDFMICIVENRRIAVTSLAARVAEEIGTPLESSGNSSNSIVGFSIRFDDQTSPQTQIKYVTDGILLREATLHDPLLSVRADFFLFMECDVCMTKNKQSTSCIHSCLRIPSFRTD
jgi:ATP-dependent RNA helicase DDX35